MKIHRVNVFVEQDFEDVYEHDYNVSNILMKFVISKKTKKVVVLSSWSNFITFYYKHFEILSQS